MGLIQESAYCQFVSAIPKLEILAMPLAASFFSSILLLKYIETGGKTSLIVVLDIELIIYGKGTL